VTYDNGGAGGVGRVIDTAQNWATNVFAGRRVKAATGFVGTIASNSATTLTLASAFGAIPTAATRYIVTAIGIDVQTCSGFYLDLCDILGHGEGMIIRPQDGTGVGRECSWGFVHRALFDTNQSGGLLMNTWAGGVIRGWHFVDSWFATTSGTAGNQGSGLYIDLNGAQGSNSIARISNVKFSVCRFQHNATRGAFLSGNTIPGDAIVFDDCEWSGNSTAGSALHSGMLVNNNFSNWRVVNGRAGETNIGPGNDYQNLQAYGIALGGTGMNTATNYQIEGLDAQTNVSGSLLLPTTIPSSARIRNVLGYNPVGAFTPPAVPLTTVAQTNPFGVDCGVFVTAGAGSTCAVAIGGTAAATLAASDTLAVRVAAGQTITLTYTSAPTWTWFGD
jgi:hypothetical protein